MSHDEQQQQTMELDGGSLALVIDDLQTRVEELEASNNITTTHTELLLEMIKIVTEIPAGKQIFNRALNRTKLNQLREIVLPRRKISLNELLNENKDMPDAIKEEFVSQQLRLIKTALNGIRHREYFEEQAADRVRNILTRFFDKIKYSRYNHHRLKGKQKLLTKK